MSKSGMTLIVKTVVRLLFPILLLFGAYVILHGHITPGGGFPGGAIIATSVAMLVLAFGYGESQEVVGEIHAEALESFGALMLVVLGLIGVLIIASGNFLAEVPPLGKLGALFSGGNLPILNIGVGIKVAAGLVTIVYAMIRFQGEEK
ncbi:hypothetical protein AKJ62_04300 [candidate division MSBL1 archaeon SCGC-AAA259D14]|uniref:Na+/H+ antiporter MnhB subunit-related protein domain-containing protein n=1 Tax=candidate division MSBL1 archaeon SCGC-AAA259D14 TaxID=1698261 RepID=A0A133U3U4_9EURY|nr:hypothetical protein AKJ62_04300 [candidate division MSBL1 archaeon SCGC-AAA259D14]